MRPSRPKSSKPASSANAPAPHAHAASRNQRVRRSSVRQISHFAAAEAITPVPSAGRNKPSKCHRASIGLIVEGLAG